jgi:hypothetical protein
MRCERCGNEHDGHYFNEKFCSQKCSRTRIFSPEQREKAAEGLRAAWRIAKSGGRIIRGADTPESLRKHSEATKRLWREHPELYPRGDRAVMIGARTQQGKNPVPTNIFDMSGRTRMKVLRRLKLSCVHCGWDKAICDLHHVRGRCGPTPHDHKFLVYICPNCHRLAHGELLDTTMLPSFETAVGDRWLTCYFG